MNQVLADHFPAAKSVMGWNAANSYSRLAKRERVSRARSGTDGDPLALTITDEDHSETEHRWITLGKDAVGHDVLVVHTFEWLADDRGRVRLISARKPTRAEIRDYEEQV